MLATWIETAAKGRLGGPVCAGMWSAAVIGTHPVQANQRVWLDLSADDLSLGLLPAYWIQNKSGNSFWHAPMPPQGVRCKLRYRSIVELDDGSRRPERVPGHARSPQPSRPDGVERIVFARSRGFGRQSDDDGACRRARVDLRPLFSDRRPPFLRPAQGRRPDAEPLPFSGDHRRPGDRPPAGLVLGTIGLGAIPAIPGRDQYPHHQAPVATGADPGLDHRFRGDGRLPAAQRRPGTLSGPVHQAILDQERGQRAAAGRVRGLCAGGDQRRDRRRGLELARRRQGPPGDQSRPHSLQPQAGTRCHHRVCHRA